MHLHLSLYIDLVKNDSNDTGAPVTEQANTISSRCVDSRQVAVKLSKRTLWSVDFRMQGNLKEFPQSEGSCIVVYVNDKHAEHVPNYNTI